MHVPTELGDPSELGNSGVLVVCGLPLAEQDPLARLEIVRKESADIKAGYIPMALFFKVGDPIMNFMSWETLQRELLATMGRGTLIWSNFPGPTEKPYVCGERIEYSYASAYYAMPQIVCSSMAGVIMITLSYAPSILRHGERFKDFFVSELQELGEASGVSGLPTDVKSV
eukprot:gnl/MRDRNA2_/MRDRNA2_150224_c0_seq1.p1 gnl/MRDRNA2_/MRDRNA2_150224_c0~~gnl/MRDRNA2_/MRDRNA2_150224_c0_seq1.p1  ORF type:complete len:185 (-),score=31.46 gnl/MRDRNA2_/MRDRNA2_150224_c0_seq1:76-588(-)